MEEDRSPFIIKEYSQKLAMYELLTSRLQILVDELLHEANIKVHSAKSRLKDKNSLQKKLNDTIGTYSTLADITDLVGIRIITYFEDEINKVAKLISDEFDIDFKKSEDKKELLDPDKFGYSSLHYIAKLSPKRLQLTEYKRFADYKFEIQIRSILQHAWAEIEHDLGYKSKIEVPRDIRRRFSRLAGLLEIADDEFIDIRESLIRYKGKIEEQISKEPSAVFIDQVSLFSFVTTNKLIGQLDTKIASLLKAKQIIASSNYLANNIIKKLNSIGLNNMAELISTLDKYKNMIVPFAERWIEEGTIDNVSKGISLFYLCYVMVGSSGSETRALNYLVQNNLVLDDPERANALATKIISICSQLR